MPHRTRRRTNTDEYPSLVGTPALVGDDRLKKDALEKAKTRHAVDTAREYESVMLDSWAMIARECVVRSSTRLEVRHTVNREHIARDGHTVDIVCADGRIDLARIYGAEIYNHTVFAKAGSRILPAHLYDRKLISRATILEVLEHAAEWQGEVFALFEKRWGTVIEEALRKEKNVNINLFSHHDSSDHRHGGCGAHGCDTHEALLETALNASVLSYWIEKRFPGSKKSIHISRLAYDTNNGTPRVVSAEGVDRDFKTTKRIDGLVKASNGATLRQSMPDTFHVQSHIHNECGVCITPIPRPLFGLQTFKMGWLESAQEILDQIELLLSIAKKNYLARNPHKPFFVHLDIPRGAREKLRIAQTVITELYTLRAVYPNLQVIVTETNIASVTTTLVTVAKLSVQRISVQNALQRS